MCIKVKFAFTIVLNPQLNREPVERTTRLNRDLPDGSATSIKKYVSKTLAFTLQII